MKRLLHKAAIILYAMAFHLLHYPRSEKSEHQKKGTKEILIIYNGIIGDGVLFADYLEMFPQIFPVRDGWKISILCRNGSPPVICINLASGSFSMTSGPISSSGLVGFSWELHIMHFALHL